MGSADDMTVFKPSSQLRSPYPAIRPYQSLTGRRRRRPIPDRISRYYVPLAVLEATDQVMRRFGAEERECYVWWGGYFTPSGEGQVLTALWPEAATDFGCVHLNNRQLLQLHQQLRSLDQLLMVELHTHPPGAGGQNEVDAAHPAATYPGFVSVVVPDFAFPRFYDLRHAHLYEYQETGQWRQLDAGEIADRFVVEETFLSVRV